MESMCSTRSFILGVAYVLLLNGCAALSGLSALSSAAPGVAASIQLGDKEVEVAKDADIKIGSKQESSVVTSKIDNVVAQKEVKVDQSAQKEDKKTEIGEVQGNVSIQQGPSEGLLAFLATGWVALALIPLVALLWLLRGRREGREDVYRSNPGETPEGNVGTDRATKVLGNEFLQALRVARALHQRIKD